jgi:hypothetical protein
MGTEDAIRMYGRVLAAASGREKERETHQVRQRPHSKRTNKKGRGVNTRPNWFHAASPRKRPG